MTAPGTFSRTRVIDPIAIDPLGHVNNVVWLAFVIEIAEANMATLGFDWEKLRDMGGIWIVRRHEVDYYATASLGDEIREETWVEVLKGARSLRRTRFTRVSDERVLVEGLTHWAYCDSKTQRPKRIPKEMLEAYAEIMRS